MPVHVFEDSLDLHIDLLEEEGYTAESWPYPRLRPTGQAETRRFRTVILENEYLRLTFIPALGGRLWELFDKRCGSCRLSGAGSTAGIMPQGLRGAEMERGFLMASGSQHSASALANVDCTFMVPESDSEPGSVLLASFSPDFFSIRATLSPGVATVRFEVTTQNRDLSAVPYQLNAIWIENDSGVQHGPDRVISSAMWIETEPGTLTVPSEQWSEGSYTLHRSPDGSWLGPRQVDAYALKVFPFHGISTPSWAGEHGVAELYLPPEGRAPLKGFAPERAGFFFCAAQVLSDVKLLVSTEDGQVFEAKVDFFPEKVHYSDLSSIPGRVAMVQLRDSTGTVLANVLPKSVDEGSESAPKESEIPAPPHRDVRKLSDGELNRLTSDYLYRVPAYLELAARATGDGEFERADACYEHALLFNGDDPLAWWAKAVNRRIGNLGAEGEERTELLNAHFLSPLEPCLRAESFLSQPRNHGRDPSPLLQPLNDCPENFVEVACQLLGAQFYEEAAYFIDEALRHQNLAMLHYFHAWLLHRKGGMEIEVASRIQLAGRAQLPPMPYRPIEREILLDLAQSFVIPDLIKKWLDGLL